MNDYVITQQPQALRPAPGEVYVHRVALAITSTANANFAFINPLGGTAVAQVRYYVLGATGTGTINIGRSDDGTGSAAGIASAGTLTAGIHENVGMLDGILIGPGGTGTNNSIVAQLDDTPTSTMGTLIVEVTYHRIQPA